MRRIIPAICALLIMGLTALPAHASEFEDMDICLGKQVLSRMLCKSPLEINFVSRVQENIYLFSVFYAKQEARFVVGVSENTIRVQGKEFLKLTKTLPYRFDKTSKCGVVEYSSTECLRYDPIVCCSEKTVEEKLDDKFWDRPIPDLLEEDLRKALETLPPEEEVQPAPEAPPAQ